MKIILNLYHQTSVVLLLSPYSTCCHLCTPIRINIRIWCANAQTPPNESIRLFSFPFYLYCYSTLYAQFSYWICTLLIVYGIFCLTSFISLNTFNPSLLFLSSFQWLIFSYLGFNYTRLDVIGNTRFCQRTSTVLLMTAVYSSSFHSEYFPFKSSSFF